MHMVSLFVQQRPLPCNPSGYRQHATNACGRRWRPLLHKGVPQFVRAEVVLRCVASSPSVRLLLYAMYTFRLPAPSRVAVPAPHLPAAACQWRLGSGKHDAAAKRACKP
eukprot:354654-Chlamydomonas_euryale.AAC.7